jgi:FHS family L-fucose permease-like MFS transporter
MNYKTFPIFLAFLTMGVADAMGPMSDAAKNQYQISNVTAMMLPFFVFIAFAVFSVPGGLLAARIGKKKLLLLGLGLNALAMLIPSVMNPSFSLLLGCIFTLGIGTTFLQVAGNPIMRDVSKEGDYSKNLSFAQGVKGLGSTLSTYLVGAITAIAAFGSMGWRGVFPMFFVFMAVTFVWVAFLKIDEAKADVPPSIGSSLSLLKKPVFSMAVLGIFLYVGAEVCMVANLKPQLRDAIGFSDAFAGKFGPVLFLGLLTIGRLLGGVVVTKVSPRNFFRISGGLGLLGGVLLMIGHKYLAIAGVAAAGLGFANIWAMLFSITVEEEPDRANELSGLMCMAISGGAIVPLIMGQCMDIGMGAMAFVVPAICFGYLLMLSLKGPSKTQVIA